MINLMLIFLQAGLFGVNLIKFTFLAVDISVGFKTATCAKAVLVLRGKFIFLRSGFKINLGVKFEFKFKMSSNLNSNLQNETKRQI